MEQDQRAKVHVLEEKRVSVDSSEQKVIPFFMGELQKWELKRKQPFTIEKTTKNTFRFKEDIVAGKAPSMARARGRIGQNR
jgi:hypothetical protein